ncbi:MAG: NAD(P)-binding protein, partial [Polyangiales bacterium]
MLRRPERIPERYPLVQDPPFSLEGVRTFAFALPCDGARLEALLDRTFGWARPELSVEPIGHHVLLAFTDVARASGADASQGHFTYREATFFVPIWGRRGGTPFAALHVPFIYPDEGLAVAAGREVYGLPKKPASLTIPSDDDFWNGAAPLTTRVLGTRELDGGPWSEQALITVTAEPQSLASRLADELLDGIDDAFGPLPGGLGPIGHLFEQDLLQLKQLPDVTPDGPPPKSLYRAVTRIAAPLRSVSNVRLGDADKVEVRVEQLASEPIRDVLGLPAAVTPAFAASFEMDFGFEPAEVWLERPSGGSAPAPEKERVLILGGGLSALATAHALTDTEERRAKYDVRVLAQGHLLGGKGASWRNPSRADRIEEHGIHVIFGFYHNFLRLFRSVYGELSRPDHVDPSTFDEAFIPNNDVVFNDGDEAWLARFPRTPAGYGAGPKTLADQLLAAGALVQSFVGGSFSEMFAGIFFPSLGNRVATEVLWFTLTLLKGVYTDVELGGKSWEDLDAQDFRDWMRSHALPGSPDLDDTAIMQVPYDGVFAYEGHDQSNPRLSAGVAARGLLKLVTDYERAVYFEMSTGMGEAVFVPMLEVLRARGVKVEFFAKVEELHVTAGRATKVRYARQARVAAGPASYDPLIQVGPVRCFRHDLDTSQLVSPVPIAGKDPYSDAVTDRAADVELEVDTDFDWVVCALPSPVTGKALRGAGSDPVLSRIGHIPTVATLHLQTWLDDRLE